MNTSTEAQQAGTKSSRFAPPVRIAILIAAIASVVLVIILALPDGTTIDNEHFLTIAGLTAAFALSERLIFHIEARNEAVSYTPSEIGVAIGLLFLFPLELVIARLVGAFIGLTLWRRQPLIKLLFNLANFVLETLVAFVVFRSLGAAHDSVIVTWGVVLLALLVALVSGGILVAVAISQLEGELGSRIRSEIVNAPVFHFPPAVLATLIAVCITVDPWLGLVALTPAPVLGFMIRSHGSLIHRLRDLTNVHDFSRSVGDATDLRDIATAAVTRMAHSARAARVTLRVWTADGTPVDACIGSPFGEDFLPAIPTDEAWGSLLSHRSTLSVSQPDPATPFTSALYHEGIEHCLVSSIADERGPVGVVVMTDREGISTRFDNDDLDRLSGMVQQLAVVVRKAQLHAQIQHEAVHDRLTELHNRSYFEAWTEKTISDGQQHAVLLVDLDRFKEINDTFGHHAGDRVLVEAAARIRSACGTVYIPSRFGGDEFAILAPGLGATEASLLAETISAALEEPFEIDAAIVAIAASVGIAIAPGHGRDIGALLRHADMAMYDAKTRRVRSTVYNEDLQEGDSTRLTLLADLRQALKDDDLDVYYQPQIDLATGRVIGAEALARWNHPEQGPISPEVFVELAERSGLIEELTRRVLGKATAAAAQWQRRGWDLTVSVNISAQSLLDERLEPVIMHALSASGLEAKRLILEITETTMMSDSDRTLEILKRVAKLGVRLSVDDFGTGYSSLSSLRHFPVSELKVDRSFIFDLANDVSDDVIVRSTIELAHNLGLTVVAEGVETEPSQHHLAELGCDIAQGYLISRPVPHLDFLFWVADHDRLTAPDPNPAQVALHAEQMHNLCPDSEGAQIVLRESKAPRPPP